MISLHLHDLLTRYMYEAKRSGICFTPMANYSRIETRTQISWDFLANFTNRYAVSPNNAPLHRVENWVNKQCFCPHICQSVTCLEPESVLSLMEVDSFQSILSAREQFKYIFHRPADNQLKILNRSCHGGFTDQI